MNDQSKPFDPVEQAAENERISKEAEKRARDAMDADTTPPLQQSIASSIKSKLEASETFGEGSEETEDTETSEDGQADS